jgi:hypothetical protein
LLDILDVRVTVKTAGDAGDYSLDDTIVDQTSAHQMIAASAAVADLPCSSSCSLHVRTIVAGAIGNGLEYYDFGVYGI